MKQVALGFGVLVLVALTLSVAAAQQSETVAWRNGGWFDGTGFRRVDVYSIGDRLALANFIAFDRNPLGDLEAITRISLRVKGGRELQLAR